MSDQLLLRVVRGSRPGFVLLRRGERVVVGRDVAASLRVDDLAVSRAHFEVVWEGPGCRLRDLGSSNGTLVNGRPATEALLREGDTIGAGGTEFRLDGLGAPAEEAPPAPGQPAIASDAAAVGEPAGELTPAVEPPVEEAASSPGDVEEAGVEPQEQAQPSEAPPEEPPVGPLRVLTGVAPEGAAPPSVEPEPGTLLARLAAELDGETQTWALLDGAQDEELLFRAARQGHPVYTLFQGDWAGGLAHVGPCLVPVPGPTPLLAALAEGLGSNLGVLLQTRADLETLHAHLRDIFVVTDEEDQEFFFRYYDPRVLHAFLPTCTPAELEEFFGPVQRWLAEDEKLGGFRAYVREGAQCVEVEIVA